MSPELYGIATVASIIMLFFAGLETNLALLLRFSIVGLFIAIGGAIASFTAGATATAMFFGLPFFSPVPIFLGTICVASSMGIAVRILSERHKMESPEGVAILAGSVFDDLIGIIALTAAASFITAGAVGMGSAAETLSPGRAVARAILVWASCAAAGILIAKPLARALKKFTSVTYNIFHIEQSRLAGAGGTRRSQRVY